MIEDTRVDHNEKVIASVRRWLDSFVIGLNLCPFAKQEYVNDRVRFVVCDAEQEEDLLLALHEEVAFLTINDSVATSLLIHPKILSDFDDYNQFLDIADRLLAQQGWLGEFQIASFHPGYRFADTQPDAAENYTNRSPYPILHLLRESMLTQAIDHYPDIDQVPTRNIQLMKDIGTEKLQLLLEAP